MARKDLGGKREQDEFSLLLSPSRGIAEDDPTSLKNPDIQERFRTHIADKLGKWSQTRNAPASDSSDLKRRNEELGIILLDLRKLREGIHSIRRIDSFACEVYEASVLLSLVASNQAQLLSSLPHLVSVIHPALASEHLAASFDSLSVSAVTAKKYFPSPATRAFYITLHLLHSHLLPAFTAPTPPVASASTILTSHPPLSTFLPTLLSLLSHSSLPAPQNVSRPSPSPSNPRQDPSITFLLHLHLALIRSSVSTIASLFSSLPLPPPSINSHLDVLLDLDLDLGSPFPSPLLCPPPKNLNLNPIGLVLKGSVPFLRERNYRSIVERAFRFPPDGTEWLSRWLLFEFEIELDRVVASVVVGAGGGGGRENQKRLERGGRQVSDHWEEEEEEEEGGGGGGDGDRDEEERGSRDRKEEAKKRAVEFVKLKRGI